MVLTENWLGSWKTAIVEPSPVLCKGGGRRGFEFSKSSKKGGWDFPHTKESLAKYGVFLK